MITDITILAACVLAAALLLWPRVADASLWRATVTPLASIIGSGFLVLGPILNANYGAWAPAMMAVLCAAAYAFGGAIRFNIRVLGDRVVPMPARELLGETLSSWVLAAAYVISVAYYLNLFGAFGVSLTPFDGLLAAKLLTTGILLLIAAMGWTRGFGAFERMEQWSVGLKLSIIAGLLVGLGLFFVPLAARGGLQFAPPVLTGWPGLALAFGLVVTVQGFETSRYLGATYDAALRIRSMRLAQIVATAIYVIYAILLAYSFAPTHTVLTETAIIDLMRLVSPILPLLLVAAALAAQFSAAVADTGGAGGLIAELTRKRVSPRHGYGIVVAGGLLLTWTSDVFQIISFASRGFALYYALQAVLAAMRTRRTARPLTQTALYVALALLGLAIALFGAPVE